MWRVIIWHSGRQWAGITADKLRIGVEGAAPTPSATSPDRTTREPVGHDWTQDGRSCADLIPDMTTTEWLGREHTNRALG